MDRTGGPVDRWRDRTGVRRRHLGLHRPLPLHVERPAAERGVDGEDLPIADVTRGARLRAVVAADRNGDVEVEDLRRLGVRQILRRRPDQLASGDGLERGHGRAQTAAAEHEAGVAHADAALDRQHPAMWVVRGAEAEELARRQSMLRIVEASPVDPLSTPTTWITMSPPAWLRIMFPPTQLRPPSTTSASPVTKRASLLAR